MNLCFLYVATYSLEPVCTTDLTPGKERSMSSETVMDSIYYLSLPFHCSFVLQVKQLIDRAVADAEAEASTKLPLVRLKV